MVPRFASMHREVAITDALRGQKTLVPGILAYAPL
jgi:hypothetical protein